MSNHSKLHQVAQPIFVAEVYMIYQQQLLMFKRSSSKKLFPNYWALPGGHIEDNEDALAAAIREVKEETGLNILPENIQLKVVAMHHHLDRQEMFMAFAFVVHLDQQFPLSQDSDEGQAAWIPIDQALQMPEVFPPVKYYFDHVLHNRPGIIYNNSVWENSQLVRVLSQTIDRNS